ncbi:glycosyltransferase [Actinoplanes italicus]|uniref:glycosyltransferase n=1 Tax=Actinoplanes italicus TaxID=113567 RepID=UPI0014755AA2|nr:glycosyltransferase [Actinoplanes italicus]
MSVVIPAESTGHLPLVFAGLPAVDEVIVVVGPDEDTVLPLPRAARVIRQTRYGAGNALACGVAAATKDVVVTLPGDGSADPAALPRFIEALRGGADVAEGCRSPRRIDLVLLWFMSVLFGCRPSGPGSGLRAFHRDRAGRLGLPRVAGTDPARGDGRDGEPLLAVRSRAAGLRVTEVPMAAHPGFGGTPLHTALYALAREHLAHRRRETRKQPAESIVILTGGESRPVPAPIFAGPVNAPRRPAGTDRPAATAPGRATGTAPDRPTVAPVNLPRQPIAGLVQGPHRWPAPNPAATGGPFNSGGLGVASPDRRRSERRSPERRRTDITPDRRFVSARPAEALTRRRWRDGTDVNRPRTQGRPNLRVINGEGGGTGGTRGHLRSV